MAVNCTGCRAEIPTGDINMREGVALCRGCGRVQRLSALAVRPEGPGVDVHHPPAGAWYQDAGDRIVVGATTRSPMAFYFVPFMIVWSGFSLGGIYGSQILAGKFNPLLSCFGIPFIAGSVLFWGLTLMMVCGRVGVCIDGESARIFQGVGRLGWTRTFRLSEISTVREELTRVSINKRPRQGIILEGSRRLVFGTLLNDERRYFVAEVLRGLLAA